MSVAAGLRHSLAVAGKLAPWNSPQIHSSSSQSSFAFCHQTQAVCISGALVFSMRLREH